MALEFAPLCDMNLLRTKPLSRQDIAAMNCRAMIFAPCLCRS